MSVYGFIDYSLCFRIYRCNRFPLIWLGPREDGKTGRKLPHGTASPPDLEEVPLETVGGKGDASLLGVRRIL